MADKTQNEVQEGVQERQDEEKQEDEPVRYSVYTTRQKQALVLVASLAGFLSPMTGSIYFPAISTIAKDLHVTDSKINLTVTTYLIVQGLAPMMIAGFSDNMGRRPAYVICFTIYITANLALGLQNSYIALLLLRMLQSGGSSGTIALMQGVIGDIITSAERGAYIGFSSATSVLGPTLSPIIGGLLAQYLGWHSVFWFLLIFAGVFFVPLMLFLPETCRKIVDDGSIPPPKLNRNITDARRHRNREAQGLQPDPAKLEELRKNYKFRFPNPFSTLVVFTDLESVLVLLGIGFALAAFYALSTGASQAFKELYGFNDIKIALMFLPLGIGGALSALTTGKMVDWNFRRHARKLNLKVVKTSQMDLLNFPIEQARMEVALPCFVLGAGGVVGYGWTMDRKMSLAGPIILLFILGYGLTAAFQVLNVLMIDIYPGRPATAMAANNVVRCLLGAASTAAIGPMTDAMGRGWAYTLLAALFLAVSPALILTMKYGMGWRQAKHAKQEQKKKEREQHSAA